MFSPGNSLPSIIMQSTTKQKLLTNTFRNVIKKPGHWAHFWWAGTGLILGDPPESHRTQRICCFCSARNHTILWITSSELRFQHHTDDFFWNCLAIFFSSDCNAELLNDSLRTLAWMKKTTNVTTVLIIITLYVLD